MINKVKLYCQKIIPLAYDNSLSYYENLCKVVKLLNDVIDVTNDIPNIINKLVSDERLKDILADLLNDLRAEIVSSNDGESSTTTKDRVVDELVWWKNKIYKVVRPMNIGDAYINYSDNPNIVHTTVEELVTVLRENLKELEENTVPRISALETMLQNAELANVKDYGAVGDGITDDTNAFNLAINTGYPVLIPQGVYKVSDVDFTNTVYFIGGVIKGGNVQFNKEFIASRTKIFDNCVVKNNTNTVGYPEWFGAVPNNADIDNSEFINTALKSFASVSLGNGDYYVSNPVHINKSNRTLYGVHRKDWAYTDESNYGTKIISIRPTDFCIKIGTDERPNTINDCVQNIVVKDITCSRTSSSDWVSNSCTVICKYLLRSTIMNVTCFNQDIGIMLQGCTNVHIEKCTVFSECLPTGDSSRTIRGVLIDNSVLSPNNVPNVSIYVTDCIINTGGGVILSDSTGIAVYSSTNNVSDLFFEGNAIEWLNMGVYIQGNNGVSTSNDIHIISNELDVIRSTGIFLTSLGNCGNVVINDNYIAVSDSAVGEFAGIRIELCTGIVISSNVIIGFPYNNISGIKLTSANGISTLGNVLSDCLTGVNVAGCNGCTFVDIIQSFVKQNCTPVIIANSSRNIIEPSINGGTGYFTQGVHMEGCTANEINVTKMISASITSGASQLVYVNTEFATEVGVFNGNLISGIIG